MFLTILLTDFLYHKKKVHYSCVTNYIYTYSYVIFIAPTNVEVATEKVAWGSLEFTLQINGNFRWHFGQIYGRRKFWTELGRMSDRIPTAHEPSEIGDNFLMDIQTVENP